MSDIYKWRLAILHIESPAGGGMRRNGLFSRPLFSVSCFRLWVQSSRVAACNHFFPGRPDHMFSSNVLPWKMHVPGTKERKIKN